MAPPKWHGVDATDIQSVLMGDLVVNVDEEKVVCWIFERYRSGDSLGKISAGLEKQSVPSPAGRARWNRMAIDKLLSNEKYTGRVLLQKTVSTGTIQIENNGPTDRYLYTDFHEAIIPDELFIAVQKEKMCRSNCQKRRTVPQMLFLIL